MGRVSCWSTCDATATTRGPQSWRGRFPRISSGRCTYGRDGLEALHGIFAACKLDPACRQAFLDPPRQLDAVLRRLQDEPAAVPWKDPKTGAGITLRIDRATFAEIIWDSLPSERAARRLPFVIARAEGGDFTALLEGAFLDGRPGDHVPVEVMYLSVTCPEETSRITASDIGRDTPDFLGSDRLIRQMNACRVWPQSSVHADVFEPVPRPSLPSSSPARSTRSRQQRGAGGS